MSSAKQGFPRLSSPSGRDVLALSRMRATNRRAHYVGIASQLLLWSIAALLSGCGPSGTAAQPELPEPPTMTCSVILIGDASQYAPAGSWSLLQASVRCNCIFMISSSASKRDACFVEPGALLWERMQTYRTGFQQSLSMSTFGDQVSPFYGFRTTNNRATGDNDFGIKFNSNGAENFHLRLEDSIIRGVPLLADLTSLITCSGCKYFSTSNITIEGVFGAPPPTGDEALGSPPAMPSLPPVDGGEVIDAAHPPPPPPPPPPPSAGEGDAAYYGVLDVTGVQAAHLDSFYCANVRDASGWACVHLEVSAYPGADSATAAVWVTNSAFRNTSVVRHGPDSWFAGLPDAESWFGAVLVNVALDTNVEVAVPISATLEISDSVFAGNMGGYGGAVAVVGQSTVAQTTVTLEALLITSCIIADNTANNGGAVYVTQPAGHFGQLTVASSNVSYNRAAAGSGGAFSILFADLAVTVDANTAISNNTASVSGGAFHLTGSLQSFQVLGGSSVSGNAASTGSGGALFACQDPDLMVNSFVTPTTGIRIDGSSHVDSNTAAWAGGGIATCLSVLSFTVAGSSSMGYNVAGTAVSAIDYNGMLGKGGALYAQRVDELTITGDSGVYFNMALTRGGGFSVEEDMSVGISVQDGSSISNNTVSSTGYGGGGVYCGGNVPVIQIAGGSKISGNRIEINTDDASVQHGGGLFVAGSLGSLLITNGSSLDSNFARRGGSALFTGALSDGSIDQILVAGGSCICNNVAATPGADSEYGALAVMGRITRFDVTEKSSICGNKVWSGGGRGAALYAKNGIGSFTLRDGSSLSYNYGGDGGAVMVEQHSNNADWLPINNFVCDNCAMDGNYARISGGVFHISGSVGNFSIAGNSSVSHNTAFNRGGALYMVQGMFGNLSIHDCLVYNNSAVYEHGGFLHVFVVGSPSMLPRGPYNVDVVRTNMTGNTAFKNGGAMCFYLACGLPSAANAIERDSLLQTLVTYIRISSSTLDANWARNGAGGAVAVLGMLPYMQGTTDSSSLSQDQQLQQQPSRLFDAFLASHIAIFDSNFSRNAAGDPSIRLSSVQDVSPLLGQGGTIFLWARPLLNDTVVTDPSVVTTPDPDFESTAVWDPAGNPAEVGAATWPFHSRGCRLQMEVVTIQHSKATGFGGGIVLASCAARIYRSTFTNNTAVVKGGGFTYMDYDIPKVALVTGPTTGAGGGSENNNNSSSSSSDSGLLLSEDGDGDSTNGTANGLGSSAGTEPWLAIWESAFNQNSATSDGGGLFLEVNQTSAVIRNCTLTANQATSEGGGLLVVASSNGTIGFPAVALQGTNISNCKTQALGGGIALHLAAQSTVTTLADVLMQGNIASNGGGLYGNGVQGTSLIVRHSKLQNNTAYNNGGGFALDFSASTGSSGTGSSSSVGAGSIATTAAFDSCELSENWAGFSGGAAAVVVDPAVDCHIANSTFTANTAPSGAGLFFDATRRGVLTVSGCNFSSNVAQIRGGGAYTISRCGGQLVLDNGSRLAGNQAALYGGALALDSTDASPDLSALLYGSIGAVNSSADGSTCGTAGLVLSGVDVSGNTAQQGGGLHTSVGTMTAVDTSTFVDNTAQLFGGSIAAVNCSLLRVSESNITGSKALLSGGGLFAEGCWMTILERTEVSTNTATAGGGIHLAGAREAAADSSTARRRSLFTVTGDDSSAPADTTAAPAVALLTRVTLAGNTAAGYYSDPGNIASQLPDVSAFTPYGRHGGGLFLTGHAGVVISNSTISADNVAAVGSALATTQVCSQSAAAHTSDDAANATLFASVMAPFGEALGAQWLEPLSALSTAAYRRCSLLVIRDTRLPVPDAVESGSATARQLIEFQAAGSQASRTPTPLLWLQDLDATSLHANCSHGALTTAAGSDSSGDSGSSSDGREAREVQDAIEASLFAAQFPITNPSVLLPQLLGMLQGCIGAPNTSSVAALAVPATHIRVMNITGAMLLPLKQRRRTDILKAYMAELSATQDTESGEGPLAMVVYPGVPIDISVQVYDGLNQPVTVDVPTFQVNLTLRPAGSWGGDPSATERIALLRGTGSSAVGAVATQQGVAAWTGVEILAWPGSYVLEVSAVVTPDSISPAYQVRNLTILVDLLSCEMGQELQTDAAQPSWTSCGTCRRDLVGLWDDTRPLLAALSPTNYSKAMVDGTKVLTLDDNGECASCCLTCPENAVCPGGSLLVPESGFWHSSPSSPVMHRCPYTPACGGSQSGDSDDLWQNLWDSVYNTAANTSYVTLAIGEDNSTVVAVVVSDIANQTTNLISDKELESIQQQQGVRALVLTMCQLWWSDNAAPQKRALISTSYNVSTEIVGMPPCVLRAEDLKGILLTGTTTTTTSSLDEITSYNDQLCASGYMGHLCATCRPSYSLSVDFQCTRCPALAQTISVGLLAFWGTIALIVFTTFSNLSLGRADAMQADELSTLDILKTLITHLQYFIIITKLGIDYPSVIVKYQSVLSAITGTENYIAYSPSCLWADLDSAEQAAVQVTFGMAGPCIMTAVTLLMWITRYLFSNQTLLRRQNGSRMNPELPLIEPGGDNGGDNSNSNHNNAANDSGGDDDGPDADRFTPPEPCQPTSSTESTLRKLEEPAYDADTVHINVCTALSTTTSVPLADATSGPASMPSKLSEASTSCIEATTSTRLSESPSKPQPSLAAPATPDRFAVANNASRLTPPENKAVAAVSRLASVHSAGQPPLRQISSLGLPLPPLPRMDSSPVSPTSPAPAASSNAHAPPAFRATAAAPPDAPATPAANPSAGDATPRSPPPSRSSPPQQPTPATPKLPLSEAPSKRPSPPTQLFTVFGTANVTFAPEVAVVLDSDEKAPASPTTANTATPMIRISSTPSVKSPRLPTSRAGSRLHTPQSSASLPKSAFQQYMEQLTARNNTSRRNAHGSTLGPGRPEEGAGGGGSGGGGLPLTDSDQREDKKEDEGEEGIVPSMSLIKEWFKTLNPRQILRHADQAIPLHSQLIIVVLVASFILYPSLCQVSLGIFACYKIDPGTGAYAANQKATWSRGYWVRNMQQECYTGVHQRLFVPVGIAAILLFCLSPPLMYFWLTWRSREQFKDSDVRLKYGFLYQQYKPKYFWWASMRQLQTLALVTVEVFGRALTVLQQALTLLAVLILIAAINNVCSPERFHLLRILEFLSHLVLALTITLGLYFVNTGTEDDQIPSLAANAIGVLILVINCAFILAFLLFMAWRHMAAAKRMRSILSKSWHSLVHSVSRAVAKIELRYSSGKSVPSLQQRKDGSKEGGKEQQQQQDGSEGGKGLLKAAMSSRRRKNVNSVGEEEKGGKEQKAGTEQQQQVILQQDVSRGEP